MKILVVSDSSIYAIGHSFIRALKEMGHETEIFDVQSAIDKYTKLGNIGRKVHTFWPVEAWTRKGNRELAIFFQRFRPHHVIVSGNAPVSFGTLAFWKSIAPETTLSLFWPDMLTNLQQIHVNSARLYDQVATYSKATIPVFQQLGFKHAIWLPFAGDSEFLGSSVPHLNDTFEYDLSFIGGWRPEREKAMLSVVKEFPDMKIGLRGNYWARESKNKEIKKIINSESLYGKSFGDFIRASRINLNVIDDTNYPAANMRFFEIPAACGLQLCSHCPEQENIFQEGEHIYYFSNSSKLIDQVEHIIKNPIEAQIIRQKSFELIKKSHTYFHRMQQIL